MEHIGIDVPKRDGQIYSLAQGGEVVEQRIRTEPERFAAVLGSRPRARILIEASTESEWVARCLEALGHEGLVADPKMAPPPLESPHAPASINPSPLTSANTRLTEPREIGPTVTGQP